MKYRLLVSLVGIPGLLLLMWLGGLSYFALITVIVLIGTYEYLRMLATAKMATRDVPLYLAAIGLLLAAGQEGGLFILPLLPGFSDSFVIITLLLLVILQTWDIAESPDRAWLGMAAHMAGFIWIAGFASSFILIRQMMMPNLVPIESDPGFRLTVALFVSVWICDSAAFFFGKRFGKTKIAPKVSPNKTVFGTVSGLVAAMLTMQVFGFSGWLPAAGAADLIVFGIITGALGQLGDLVESRLKRDVGVKDSGALLPGHGGILDRFDSLLFVMPLSLLYLKLSG